MGDLKIWLWWHKLTEEEQEVLLKLLYNMDLESGVNGIKLNEQEEYVEVEEE